MPALSTLQAEAALNELEPGACVLQLVVHIAEKIGNLVDQATVRADALEVMLSEDRAPPVDCRQQLTSLRNQYLKLETIIRQTLVVVEAIINDDLDLKLDGDHETRDPVSTRHRTSTHCSPQLIALFAVALIILDRQPRHAAGQPL